jgi:hypothetical protein
VQALEDLEEERNAVQAGVDELRRLLKLATEQRFEQLENLKQVVQNLRNSATKLSQRDE